MTDVKEEKEVQVELRGCIHLYTHTHMYIESYEHRRWSTRTRRMHMGTQAFERKEKTLAAVTRNRKTEEEHKGDL